MIDRQRLADAVRFNDTLADSGMGFVEILAALGINVEDATHVADQRGARAWAHMNGLPFGPYNPFVTACGATCTGTSGIAATNGVTPWMTTTAPVVGGETITLELVIFDGSDQIVPTSAVLDNFQWSDADAPVATVVKP